MYNPSRKSQATDEYKDSEVVTVDVLRDILMELRKMNLHLQLITNDEITEKDL